MQGKNIQIPNDQALLICGKQGTGKTLLAAAIAEQYGAYQETDTEVIRHPEAIERAMREGIKTLIVECDDANGLRQLPPHIKAAISGERIPAKLNGKAVTMEVPPRFIFCSADPDAIKTECRDRRFFVIDISATKH